MCQCTRHGLMVAVGIGVGVVIGVGAHNGGRSEAAEASAAPKISHTVYFALNDSSDAAKAKLVAACKKYLTAHPGELFFSVGTLGKEFSHPLNDKDWDVVIQFIFKDKAAFETYAESARHKEFVEVSRAEWKKVRVFDALTEEMMVSK